MTLRPRPQRLCEGPDCNEVWNGNFKRVRVIALHPQRGTLQCLVDNRELLFKLVAPLQEFCRRLRRNHRYLVGTVALRFNLDFLGFWNVVVGNGFGQELQ